MNPGLSARLVRVSLFKFSAIKSASFFVSVRPAIPAPIARISAISLANLAASSRFVFCSEVRFRVNEKTSKAFMSAPAKPFRLL